MKISVVLETEDFNCLHDVLLETLDISYTDEKLQEFWDLLPEDEKGLAYQWGCNDTVFSDNIHEWSKENRKLIINALGDE